MVVHTINTDTHTDTDRQFENRIDLFKTIVEPLQHTGWQFMKTDTTTIIMNKKFHELEEINIQYKNSYYHFSLPLKNSVYCYYKRIADEQQSIQFLKTFVSHLIQ